MRTKHTLINISAGLGNQLIITALSFVSRTVFITTLGVEYLGVNALFTSMLAMISLAEAGIGSSIVYNLYKPVADQDEPKMIALMKLYRKAYMAIALIVFILGLGLMPFLGFFVKGTSVENIHLIYLLFLLNTVVPYFFVYKHSFLNVNQKNYIVTMAFTVSTIVSTSLKIGVLYFTENFMYYLLVESMITVTASVLLSVIADRMYPFLKRKPTEGIDPETKSNIVRNVKAIVLQNVGSYFVLGADSLLISSFVSVAAVGLYSNYKMLIDICRNFVYQVSNNMYHSVGNLVAKESREKVYFVFKGAMLLGFWLYATSAIMLYMIMEPFITVWIGEQYVMSPLVLGVLVVMYYERGMRNAITTVKTTAGIFHEDRYAPLFQAAINLGASILFMQWWGLAGVFIGTLASAVAVPFWTTPYLVYKKVFDRPLWEYYRKYLWYMAVAIIAFLAASFTSNAMAPSGWGGVFARLAVAFSVPNLIFAAVFYRTEEYKYLYGIVQTMAGYIVKRFHAKGEISGNG